jgi:hypothetical protein
MANTVSTAFIKQYDMDTHLAYQQKGSKFRNRVRVKEGVTAATVDFRKIGKGAATQKPQNGNIVAMNPAHSIVTATLADWYAPEYVDKFDEQKLGAGSDERNVLVQTGVNALGRKVDEIITTQMLTSTNIITGYDAAVFNLDGVLAAIESFLGVDAFEQEGMISMALGTKQWLKFLNLTEVKNSDYNNEKSLTRSPGASRLFMGIDFFHYSGLPTALGVTKNILFDKRAVGWAEGAGITSEMNYIPEKVSTLVNSMFSGGAVLIDTEGVAILPVKDAA